MIARYVEDKPAQREARIVRILRAWLLIGVWLLTGLAGLAVWVKLSA